MSIITKVEPQKKNSHRFNIFLDGQFAFGADEDLVVSEKLIPGRTLNVGELERLLFEAEVGKLMERMYNLFSIRQRSEKEIRDYFRVKNLESRVKGREPVSDLVVDALIVNLKQKGMLNDLEFAKSWVQSRRRSKNKSSRALKMELMKKGIGREVIDEVTRVESLESSEEQLAKLALEKKMKAWKNLPQQEFKKKAYEFLLRRGFNYSEVKNVVENIFQKE